MRKKPSWHKNPGTLADVIASLESLGYVVFTRLDACTKSRREVLRIARKIRLSVNRKLKGD